MLIQTFHSYQSLLTMQARLLSASKNFKTATVSPFAAKEKAMNQYFDVMAKAQELSEALQGEDRKSLVHEVMMKIVNSEQYTPSQLKIYVEQLVVGSGSESDEAKEKYETLCKMIQITMSPQFI